VGERDWMIGAPAVAVDYSIATRDERSFPKIPGLSVQRYRATRQRMTSLWGRYPADQRVRAANGRASLLKSDALNDPEIGSAFKSDPDAAPI